MHELNIETLRDEALRLVQIEINVLTKMMEVPGVLVEAKSGEIQTLDRFSAPKHVEMLTGERSKLKDLEMVVAVVGTVKAGKSTSINAIAGTEILPNRPRPMTALPTLIRHTPGQLLPVLTFANAQPIHELVTTLQKEIRRRDNAAVAGALAEDPNMKGLVEIIRTGETLLTRYQGAEEIFTFLSCLNDLVRISAELGVDFPFDAYDDIHALPLIEVEFAHLRESSYAKGRLSLLDTPGPNEFGQPHLRKMLKDQLRKASAVLSILDYTQLQTTADAEVRQALLEIADFSGGRLFTLVNKFDERDRHGESEDEVKVLVSGKLMKGKIKPTDVYPVSSRCAYLANRARQELFLNNKLPDPKLQEWVADFGKEAFGRSWFSKIDDGAAVKEQADCLWRESLLDAPLEGVIRVAQRRAAAYAVDAAAAKLVVTAERISNLLNVRESALSHSVQELQTQITALQRDVGRVETSEAASQDKAELTLAKLKKTLDLAFVTVTEEVEKTLERYFREGKRLEKAASDRALRGRKNRELDARNLVSLVLSTFFPRGGGTPTDEEPDFDPTSPVMKFTEQDDALSLIGRITDALSDIFSRTETTLKIAVDSITSDFQKDFKSNVVSEARKITEEMKDRLTSNGFSVELTVPDSSKLELGFDAEDMLSDVLMQKSETVIKFRRQKGLWGTLCSWFDTSDWGWEVYHAERTIYEVDILKIKASAQASVSLNLDGLAESLRNYIQNPLKESIDLFFAELKKMVEQIRGDLLQSIRDQEKSKAEQDALMRRLVELNKGMPEILKDSRDLKRDVEPLVTAQGGDAA